MPLKREWKVGAKPEVADPGYKSIPIQGEKGAEPPKIQPRDP
jgi:hypothetical protein